MGRETEWRGLAEASREDAKVRAVEAEAERSHKAILALTGQCEKLEEERDRLKAEVGEAMLVIETQDNQIERLRADLKGGSDD